MGGLDWVGGFSGLEGGGVVKRWAHTGRVGVVSVGAGILEGDHLRESIHLR